MNLGGAIRVNRFGVCIIVGVMILLFIYMYPAHQGSPRNVVNLRQVLIAAIDAAEKGGKEVVKAKEDKKLIESSKGKTKEGANVPVTSADFKSHCVMYYGLQHIFPLIQVISEETGYAKECKDVPSLEMDPSGDSGVHGLDNLEVDADQVTVWIDPLDATQEFTEGLLEYVTTMVCVAVSGRPVIGVIHKPFVSGPDKTYWAWVNHGSSPTLKASPPPEQETVIISRSHAGQVSSLIKSAFGENTKIITAGGSGYKVLELVSGRASVYLHKTSISKWDICAGDAVLTSLDGSLTDLQGRDIDYSATASHVNDQGLLASLRPPSNYLPKLSPFNH